MEVSKRPRQPSGWGKRWFKHHLYQGRLIITSGLNMFKSMGGPTLTSLLPASMIQRRPLKLAYLVLPLAVPWPDANVRFSTYGNGQRAPVGFETNPKGWLGFRVPRVPGNKFQRREEGLLFSPKSATMTPAERPCLQQHVVVLRLHQFRTARFWCTISKKHETFPSFFVSG